MTLDEDISFSFPSPQQEKLDDWFGEDASGEYYQTSEYPKLCQTRGWVLQQVFQQGLHQRNLQPTCPALGLGIRSIRVIRFGLFGFVKFRVLKNENRNFQKYFRNRTQIDSQFRFGLFGSPNRPEL
jgi:hypothetical protein